ncbi:hypothetical protein [Nonomuraea basaltis]|nr:hypothetical protein [Nonomuraea basaltis]
MSLDNLAAIVHLWNAVSGGTLLPVVAGLWVFVIGCALIAVWQVRRG